MENNNLWRRFPVDTIDGPARLMQSVLSSSGDQAALSTGFVGIRVPPEVAAERRRKMRAEARDRCRPIKPRRLLLADWALLLTNVPPDMLSPPEAQALYRARWQIEMLSKLWKSYGRIARWRSRKPMRMLCEVYAKLLAMLVQHWILIASCWAYPGRSLAKASATIRPAIGVGNPRSLDRPGRLRSASRVNRNCVAFFWLPHIQAAEGAGHQSDPGESSEPSSRHGLGRLA